MAALTARADGLLPRHQRFIERVTAGLGRPHTLYATLVSIAGWIGFNALAPRIGLPRFDPPPFQYLQGLVALLALLTTTMVLITQNRQALHAQQRAHLDLQVNLSSEQKTAKIIELIEELRRDLPSVPNRRDPVADALKRAVDPERMIKEIERTLEEPSK